MSKDTEDPLEDLDSLVTMIGGAKRKDTPPKKPDDTPVVPSPPRTGGSTDGTGDFSALMKKLGMANRQKSATGPDAATPPDRSSPLASPPAEPEEEHVLGFDDLLEDEIVPEPRSQEFPSEKSDLPGSDVRSSLGTLPATTDTPREAPGAPPESAPDPALPAGEVIVEILDEDPKAALRRPRFAKKATETAEVMHHVQNETEPDEKIITVDQISDLSGLILPRGATFRIEELKLHGRINAFEGARGSALPAEFAEIWKKEFSTAGFKDLDMEEGTVDESAKLRPAPKKFSLSALFHAIRTEEVTYDPRTHGPLVDLVFHATPGIEEMEMYPVNEPYAYIRIIYDHSTHEYTYQVLEPVLTDPEKELLKELKERLFETLDINTKDMSPEEARQKLRAATNDILADYGFRLDPATKEKLHYNMHKDFLGNGLIDPIMHDKYIEDISCDGIHTPLFAFHSSYESMKTTLAYHTAEDLDSFVTKLAQRAGKYISIAEPILDASMQDGSRIQMTLGTEVTAHGSTFTIRKFKDEPITPTDLIEWHTFAPLSIAYIWLAVENGKSAIFAGGTASGKTTALNAISLFIPPMAKIVSLEDTREVKLPHPNWIPSVTRDSFDTAGRGEINMYELLRAAMRQRPEYIIVGEVRGKECQTLFQAMSTGHVTYSTTHADSVASVVHRIENPPMNVPRNMLSALDFICVQVQARVGGKRIRRNKQIVEILDIDPRTNELITNEVFKWRSATDEHTYSGKSYLLEEIMEAKGWSENRMREELKRRQEVLEWMRIKKIRHYKDVAKILISYHRDPEAVIEKVRKDLYE